MKLVSRNDLRSILSGISATTIVSLVSIVEPDMRAKNENGLPNPFKVGKSLKDGFTIDKVNKVNGTIAGKYERIVSNRLAVEIQNERTLAELPPLTETELSDEISRRFAQGTSWHRPIMNADGTTTCLSVNKKDTSESEAYLRVVVRSTGEPEYLDTDGFTVPEYLVSPYLAPKSDYTNQGLDKAVVFLCYKLSSIVEIAVGGERYRVIDNLVNLPQRKAIKVWEIAEEYIDRSRTLTTV